MKALKALRLKVAIEDIWKSPQLHVLLTKEDDLIVARCLDFTVSSHGNDEKDALQSLAETVKESVLTAVENSCIDTLNDPAHNKYWQMFNELESKQLHKNFKKSLSKSKLLDSRQKTDNLIADITYA